MIAFAASRVLQSLVALFVISFIGFLLVNNLGDPLASLLAPDATLAERTELIHSLHLDDPFLLRFWDFLSGLLHGDFGLSYRSHDPVAQMIAERIPATTELALTSLALTLLIGVPAGVYCGVNPRSLLARIIMTSSIVGVTLPTFVVGVLLIAIFSVDFAVLPSFGRGTVTTLGFWTTGFATPSGLRAIVLPAITLSLFQITFVIRIIRTQLMEVGQTEYIRFAKARGLANARIWFVHALKNTLLPVITVLGLQLGNIIAFSIVTENVFAWPGLGSLFLQSIESADMPVISIYLILIGTVYMLINLAVELSYPLIDPRVLRRQT